jgi:hypothetical protein
VLQAPAQLYGESAVEQKSLFIILKLLENLGHGATQGCAMPE